MYEHLFKPAPLGSIEIKNRLVVSPVITNYAGFHGEVTDLILSHYSTLGAGGFGLVIVEGTAVEPRGRVVSRQLGIWEDDKIKSLSMLAGKIKEGGAKVSIQLHHAGRRALKSITGEDAIAPSPIARNLGAEIPHALSIPEISAVIENYVAAAIRVKTAGFDAVDLHGAHGYLIAQFMSPLSNTRQDAYGGDLKGRCRFAIEILNGIKTACGKDFPVTMKINGDEFIQGGLTNLESQKIAMELEKSGLDGLQISAGTGALLTLERATNEKISSKTKSISLSSTLMPHTFLPTLPMVTKRGCYIELANSIKQNVHIPVMALGRINEPSLANEVIATGKADFVALGRAVLADPTFARKAEEGNKDDIRPCIACNHECGGRLYKNKKVLCSVNPDTGKNKIRRIHNKGTTAKKVLVIGGGPAGLEAARTIAIMGHSVTLMEENSKVGGQMLMACVPPSRDEFKSLIKYYENQMKTLGVDVLCNSSCNESSVAALNPDCLIIATGSMPRKVDVMGWDGLLLTADEVLQREETDGRNTLVIGGGLIGWQTADYLCAGGNKVYLDDFNADALQLEPDDRAFLTNKFQINGVTVFDTQSTKIDNEQVVLGGEASLTLNDCDLVVISVGRIPRRDMIATIEPWIKGKRANGYEVGIFLAGDCKRPMNLSYAIHGGRQVSFLVNGSKLNIEGGV